MNYTNQNIKFLREYLKETQTGFAKRFGVTRAMISSYELHTARKPDTEFMLRICNYFNITIEQLSKQKLTESDLAVTGRTGSVTEVRLEEALKRIDLLEKACADKDEIIALQKKLMK